MKVGLVGCGAIGSYIAASIAGGRVEAELEYVYDLEMEKAKALAEKARAKAATSLEEVLSSELVVEAASIEAARELIPLAVQRGKDLLVLSVGALAEESFLSMAQEGKARLYLPSGAIGALDALKSAREAELEEVTLVTTKSPEALEGTPQLQKEKQKRIEERTLLFDGYAREAIKAFPQNVNVAVAVSLAGLGVDRTRVKVYADPLAKRNTHELFARGAFGRLQLEVENLPSPQNPRTSQLAALSAVATLRKITSSLRVGT